ncbi:17303_t:CDS:2 [Cetraspora pellucida]|uniref:17303_t:CDS:1 n=1 Tax=Cetraspora pellucida TaxID=1433469 RepID=A0A9N9F4H8_9GLOM|nr:17303_t:CDS:2 [Cetraspora pellucida]
MLTANATRTEKLKPIVIESFIEPRALVHLNYNALLDDVDELIIDLTTNLPDPTIERQLNEFNSNNDYQIPTEDILDKEQIINIVLDKQREFEEGNTSDTDIPPSEIPVLEGLDCLKKFISFFEQQESHDFNVEDLKLN